MFSSWMAFGEFVSEISTHRFTPTSGVRAFLDEVRETSGQRASVLNAGDVLWRAQHGCKEDRRGVGSAMFVVSYHPLSVERMVPTSAHVRRGGRGNPAGVAYLYLADQKNTAVAEVRPWVGARVTVAEFRVLRRLRLLDLTVQSSAPGGGDTDSAYAGDDLSPDQVAQLVWGLIEYAYAKPVGPGDAEVDYVPTQYLAEFVRECGFDGMKFRSAMDGGNNVMLFDPLATEVGRGEVVEVLGVQWSSRVIGGNER